MLFIALVDGCIEKYETPPSKYPVSYLVVDGFLDATKKSAEVKLSRTLALSDNEFIPLETGATVTVEDQSGSFFKLDELKDGNYTASDLLINSESKYRIHVVSAKGGEYHSDYVPVLTSPSLDSITWEPSSDGVTIYANSHGDDNETHSRFYKWNFVEVWEYTAAFFSYFRREGNVVIPRTPEENIYMCWLTEANTEILVGTTERLTDNILSKARITFIPKGSLKLGRIFSILVKQKAITEESYNYWLQLQKSTENLGGLFDPLPSQVLGNMHSEEDTAEPVLGYFAASTVEEKRIFIEFNELPDDLLVVYNKTVCEQSVIPKEEVYTIGNKILLLPISPPGLPVSAYTMTTFECGDCTVRGGVTTKPDFWIR